MNYGFAFFVPIIHNSFSIIPLDESQLLLPVNVFFLHVAVDGGKFPFEAALRTTPKPALPRLF